MPRVLWLADALRAAGLTVVEHDGWRTRGRPGAWTPVCGIVHATAAPRTQPDTTQVAIVRDGREGLVGPIANACVDRQGRWHVLAAGRCNTTRSGTAGPYEGVGNAGCLGVEACNDNLSEPWPSAQYESYARGWAAICARLGWTPQRLRGHKEHTPGRKSDPTFDMDGFRSHVQRHLSVITRQQEDDMATIDQADWEALIWRVEAITAGRATVQAGPTQGEQVALADRVSAIAADVAELKTRTEPAPLDPLEPGEVAPLGPEALAAIRTLVKAAVAELLLNGLSASAPPT